MPRQIAPVERALSLAELGAYTMSRVKTWIGGFRQNPESWSEPRNWYPRGVPEWQDKVVIGGYGRHRCHIDRPVDAVMSVHVLRQARLHIGDAGVLSIDGLFADPLGLICGSGLHNEGSVEIDGSLILRNVTSGGIDNCGLLANRGRISADNKVTRSPSAWGHFVNSGTRDYRV